MNGSFRGKAWKEEVAHCRRVRRAGQTSEKRVNVTPIPGCNNPGWTVTDKSVPYVYNPAPNYNPNPNAFVMGPSVYTPPRGASQFLLERLQRDTFANDVYAAMSVNIVHNPHALAYDISVLVARTVKTTSESWLPDNLHLFATIDVYDLDTALNFDTAYSLVRNLLLADMQNKLLQARQIYKGAKNDPMMPAEQSVQVELFAPCEHENHFPKQRDAYKAASMKEGGATLVPFPVLCCVDDFPGKVAEFQEATEKALAWEKLVIDLGMMGYAVGFVEGRYWVKFISKQSAAAAIAFSWPLFKLQEGHEEFMKMIDRIGSAASDFEMAYVNNKEAMGCD